MKSNIRNNYVYNIIYRLSIMALPLFITPHVSRVLGVDNNGLFTFSNTLALLFVMFGKLGVDIYGSRSIAFCRDDIEERSRVFWSLYILQLGASAVSILVYMVTINIVIESNHLIYLLQAIYVVSMLFDVSWLFYGMEKFRLTALRSVISRVIMIICVYLFVATENDLWIFVLVMATGVLVEQLMLLPFLFKIIKFTKLTLRDITIHIKPNLRLFIPLLAFGAYNWLNKIMLGFFVGAGSVAMFGYSESMVMLPKGIITALGPVMMPAISHMLANNQLSESHAAMKSSMTIVCFISCALCFGIAGVSSVFMPWFLGPGYEQTVLLTVIFSPVMIPIGVTDVIQSQYLIPHKLDYIYVKSIVLGALVSILIYLLLIPHLGALGAVVGIMSAEITICLYQMNRIKHVYTLRELLKTLIPFLGFGLVEFIVASELKNLTLPVIPLLLCQIFIAGGVYLFCSLIYFSIIYRKMGGVRMMIRTSFGKNR